MTLTTSTTRSFAASTVSRRLRDRLLGACAVVVMGLGIVACGADVADEPIGGCVNYGTSDLSGEDLSGKTFNCSAIGDAVFVDANLTNADFRGAMDIGAPDFRGADLTGANLVGEDFTRARFDGATWSGTACPDGTSSDDHGGTCEGHLAP